MLTTPIFTRLLSTEEYGQYTVFNSWMDIITIVVTLNLCYGFSSQGLIKYETERKEFVSSMQGLTLTQVGIWTVIYILFHGFWNNLFSLSTVQMLAGISMIWTGNVFNFWAEEQRVTYRYRRLALITIIVVVAKPVLGIFLVMNAEDKVTARILGLAIVQVVYVILFVVQMRRGRIFYSKKFWGYALSFGIPLLPHYLSQVVLSSSDRIMIEKMVGMDEAGIYGLAYSIAMLMSIFGNVLTQTIGPWNYQKIKEKKLGDISQVVYPAIIMVATVNILLIAFAPDIVAICAPEEYRNAIWVIPPVTMSVFFMFLYGFFSSFEFYYEKTKYLSIATLAEAVLNVILNFCLIPVFGYYAAGYTTLVCYAAYALFHYYFMRKICRDYLDGDMAYQPGILLLITVCFLASGFLFMFTYKCSWLRYTLVALILLLLIAKRKYLRKKINELLRIKSHVHD